MWRGFKVAILAMRLICMKDKLESIAIIHAFLEGNIEVFPLLLKKICIFCYIQLLLEWDIIDEKLVVFCNKQRIIIILGYTVIVKVYFLI